MIEKIDTFLESSRQAIAALRDESVNYLYMAGLLCYEAALRNDRLFFYGEGESYFTAMKMAYHIRQRYPKLQVALLQDEQEDIRRFATYASKGDVVVLISNATESAAVAEIVALCREREVKSVGMSGMHNKQVLQKCDVNIVVHQPSLMQIEAIHALIAQMILEMIDTVMQSEGNKGNL